MGSSELKFMFEIEVEDFKSFSKATNSKISAQFGEVFSMRLKDPSQLSAEEGKIRVPRSRKTVTKKQSSTPPQRSIQHCIVVSDVESLVDSMLRHPIEITHYSIDVPFELGVAEIPWMSHHINYLHQLKSNNNQPPLLFKETCITYDEYTSKRVAVINLKVQLHQIKDDISPTIKKTNNDKKIEFVDFLKDTGTIKTIYSDKKRVEKSHKKKKIKTILNNDDPVVDINEDTSEKYINQNHLDDNSENRGQEQDEIVKIRADDKHDDDICQIINTKNNAYDCKKYNSILNLVRSQTRVDSSLFAITKHWSSTSVEIKERLDTLNYIFGNLDGPFGNRIYCVGYFTVENNRNSGADSPGKSPASTTTSPATTPKATPRDTSPPRTSSKSPDKNSVSKFSMNICSKECVFGGQKNTCFEDVCNIDLKDDVGNFTRCKEVTCDSKRQAASLTDPLTDEIPLLVDFGTSRTTAQCCIEKVEQVIGGVSGKLINDPCLCTCDCTFGFVKKTTYCSICGGFEVPGDEMKSTRGGAPFPCPIYHGLVKGKKTPEVVKRKSKSLAANNDDSMGSDKDATHKKKRRRDQRFKFNYGYKGIPPHIGHSQCALPCTGDLNPVPKHMGWLWTANNIPGLKVRPKWRPGAANKHVVRMLRIARFPEEILSKRKRRDAGKKKRPLKRPLLVVQKKDGEYNVTMETMRTFNKPRAVNQYPYEDKPLVQYKVGRTDEENAERKKRRERAQRRLEREQRAFLQSAFHDMCKEICLKTYQQAIGVLPFAEDSFCPCYPEQPPPDRIDESHSCSCTESTRSSGSMTDDDEWIIEFTPPNAYFNPTRVVKKVHTTSHSTQYTYLDYRVNLLDSFGNPVPRFFTGPDGKQQCSDLGGFWGPGKKWLEINVDGFVGPDGRWAPNNFIGPCGDLVDAETGKFQSSNGVWLTVGVDGYVDCNEKWHFYTKAKQVSKDPKLQRNVEAWVKAGKCVKDEFAGTPAAAAAKQVKAPGPGRKLNEKKSEAAWSCFGDASPRALSHMGIFGHGQDRRLLLSTLEQLLKQGQDVKIPYKRNIAPVRHGSRKPRYMDSDQIKCKHYHGSTKDITVVNDQGQKTLFRLNYKNPRPKQRIQALGERGISLSSFHVPCFSSFINSEMARQQQLQHILQHNARVMESTAQTL